MYDVVIVGAGPTGCYAARQLAQLGYEVLVLEEHTEIGEPVHCTGIISREACERFDLSRESIEAQLCRARFFSPGGHSFCVSAEEPQAVVVDRSAFDRRLAQQALAGGASFLLGARATEISVEDDRVSIGVRCLGEPYEFGASLAIIATGVDDGLLRQLRLAEASRAPMFGAQLFADTGDLAEVEIYLGRSVAPGGFAWAVPANGHGCRVGLLSDRSPRPALETFADALEARGAIRRNGSEVRCRAVPSGPRTPSFCDRVLVVGDAAGQVKSTTSGGIYYGLLGAEAAVSAADEALRGGALGAEDLAGYEEQWRRQLGGEQRTGSLIRGLQSRLTDGELDSLFWLAGRTGLPRLLSRLHFDWHSSGLLALLWRHIAGAPAERSSAVTIARRP